MKSVTRERHGVHAGLRQLSRAAVEACTDAFESCTALLPWRVDAKGPETEQCAAAYKECLERSGC